ncbi:MAG: hypothetical protein JRJ86_14965 [Deltaproteobacteria bacterium]|nr:hypothetical protein [Deltaproteobacteria bacterium]MBW2119776.1 hypothetical protein [Deltaproteobacteria bacterium]
MSPKVAGLLSGYPLGAAIALFFYGIEVSPEFASKSAIYTMIGLVASQAFAYCYYRASVYFKKFNIFFSSIIAVSGYFLVIWLIHFIKLNHALAVVIPVISIFLFSYLLRGIDNIKIQERLKLNCGILFLRAIFAGSIILVITGTAKWVSPTWAGLLSAFPVTLFPLMIIIHFAYGRECVHTIIKNFPAGLGSLIAYSLTVSIVYPVCGIYLGTFVSFTMATVYLLIYYFITEKLKGSRKVKLTNLLRPLFTP